MDLLGRIFAGVDAIFAECRNLIAEYHNREHWPVQNWEDDAVVVLAQQTANMERFVRQQRANMERFVRGSFISRGARLVDGHVREIVALRVNVSAFVTFYPAATELRTKLGHGVWESLENYRGAVTYLAFSTLRGKTTAGNELPAELKAFLNENTAHMITYIRARYREPAFSTFRDILDSLEEVIEGEKSQGIKVQQGWPMKFLTSKFRRQPIFWLMYNLNFPVEGRMSWDQLSMWAIQKLRKRGDTEPPTWPIELRGLDGWNQDATGMWNEAVIEVFTDIRRRFCAIERLH